MINFESMRGYARLVGWGPYLWRTFVRQFAKRVLRCDLELRLPTGLKLHLPRSSHYASVVWLTQAHVDEGCEEILFAWLETGGDFFDVGAHLGYYSLWCAPRVRRVHAFEPDRRNQPWLQQNAIRAGNITVNFAAVSDFYGEIILCQDPSSAQSHVVGAGELAISANPSVRVPCTTLDRYWHEQGRPSVGALKIDVEGHELAVLRGATEIFKVCRPIGLIETVHAHRQELVAMLDAWQYRAVAAVASPAGRVLTVMDANFSPACDFTMVFLVPSEKAERFRHVGTTMLGIG